VDVLHRRLARRIREIADEREIPLSHLADRAGVTRSHLAKVLAGGSSPTVAWLDKIARVLGVDVDDLLTKTPAPKTAVRRRR
jgi:transcriptional regulator with XRE-family HTH domain